MIEWGKYAKPFLQVSAALLCLTVAVCVGVLTHNGRHVEQQAALAAQGFKNSAFLLNERIAATKPDKLAQMQNDAERIIGKTLTITTKADEEWNGEKYVRARYETLTGTRSLIVGLNRDVLPESAEGMRKLSAAADRLDALVLHTDRSLNGDKGVLPAVAALVNDGRLSFATANKLLSEELRPLLVSAKEFIEGATATNEQLRQIATQLAKASGRSEAAADEFVALMVQARASLKAAEHTTTEGQQTLVTLKRATWANVLIAIAKLFL